MLFRSSEAATCTAIVAGLPPSYKHLMHILDNQTCTFTIESVRNSILRFDATESLGKGLSAVTVSTHKPKSKKFCSFCNKYGHTLKKCWKVKPKKAKEQHGVICSHTDLLRSVHEEQFYRRFAMMCFELPREKEGEAIWGHAWILFLPFFGPYA